MQKWRACEDDAYVHAKCNDKDVPRNSRSPKTGKLSQSVVELNIINLSIINVYKWQTVTRPEFNLSVNTNRNCLRSGRRPNVIHITDINDVICDFPCVLV